MEDKYWTDYTIFIDTVEGLTKYNPAEILERYTILVRELEHGDDQDFLEWQYESETDGYTRTKIQSVLDCEILNGNLLLDEFQKKIDVLDKKLEKFLKANDYNDDTWKKRFTPDLIDWQKVRGAE